MSLSTIYLTDEEYFFFIKDKERYRTIGREAVSKELKKDMKQRGA